MPYLLKLYMIKIIAPHYKASSDEKWWWCVMSAKKGVSRPILSRPWHSHTLVILRWLLIKGPHYSHLWLVGCRSGKKIQVQNRKSQRIFPPTSRRYCLPPKFLRNFHNIVAVADSCTLELKIHFSPKIESLSTSVSQILSFFTSLVS